MPRRTLLAAGVWAAPVVMAVSAVPAAVASEPTASAQLSASFAPVSASGVHDIDLVISNASATVASTSAVWQLTTHGGSQILGITASSGSVATPAAADGVRALGAVLPGEEIGFTLQVDARPAPTGDVLTVTVIDDGEVVALATVTIPGYTGERPDLVRSFGPNGTHWPAHTPWIGLVAPNVLEVDCTWPAIAAAIRSVSDEQAAEGVHIRVRPGTLPGDGAGSSADGMIDTAGSVSWAQNVLVSPRDGRGTVTITDSARLRSVHGVTFARIDGRAMLLTNCSRSAWAQSTFARAFGMTSSYTTVTENCGAYEVVVRDPRVGGGDISWYAAGDGCVLDSCVWEGCYSAPVFRASGNKSHDDTLQMYGSGWYRGLTVRDSTLFGSLNSALQIGGVSPSDPRSGEPFVTLDHSILTSQRTAITVRFGLPEGAYDPKRTQAINGTGDPGNMYARDSHVFGSISESNDWQGENSTVSEASSASDAPGGWEFDGTLAGWTSETFDAVTPEPTDAYLAQIWS
ncbi:hypothetical protein [Microbacterium thalassium]|uniref:Uncharacterized protein n=1 Tax=Microbacterium thalassium TaxID=362649 RepID=A0A7X0FPB0_9MICO|nr:hypothetical protein [Microbacterium thalassium]MBB6391205.1 hypothetical protein [Microbacterium thalassium]